MRLRDVDELPPTLNTEQAAELLGVGRDHLWRLARDGCAPVEPLRLGRTLRWPTAALLDRLGLRPRDDAGPEAGVETLEHRSNRDEETRLRGAS